LRLEPSAQGGKHQPLDVDGLRFKRGLIRLFQEVVAAEMDNLVAVLRVERHPEGNVHVLGALADIVDIAVG
jgi:hypothetical protein